MKKLTLAVIAISLLILTSTACTLHLPYDWEWDTKTYHIILKVDPDDAEVLLNGKLVGYAYEFSTPDAAIKLASRNNELVIKREGFIEEEINLYEYGSHRITIRLKLLKDKDYVAPRPEEREGVQPKPPKVKPEYKAKTAPPKPLPEEIEKAEQAAQDSPANKLVEVKLHVKPDEAAIYLDGKFWGLSPKSGVIENLRLKPGKYNLEVVKPGYTTYKKILYVADQNLKLIVYLEKK